jgi:ABC-type dipeptide/oligopeptide/nickel transport system ATPase component
MKRADLHIHTKATVCDPAFVFDINELVDYISNNNLDIIAITNHNEFDLVQYQAICEKVSIPVLPGVEISIESCHVLIIADRTGAADFSTKCEAVSHIITSKQDQISFETLRSIFTDFSKYLIIPHYEKDPKISESLLEKFGDSITAGEVSSPKKFMHCYRNTSRLVPVLFSDLRIQKDCTKKPSRFTFLKIGDVNFSAIRAALSDREKVRLSAQESPERFACLNGILELSAGLTVVLGERSSGKSFTLDRIAEEFQHGAKYIRQFELLERDNDADEKAFSEYLRITNSRIAESFLAPLKSAVDQMSNVDLAKDYRRIDEYLEKLLERARETELEDAYAKVRLFNDTPFNITKSDVLSKLVMASETLLANTEYRTVIESRISLEALRLLLLDLINEQRKMHLFDRMKIFANEIHTTIKKELAMKSATTSIPSIDFSSIALDLVKIEKFNALVSLVKTSRIISRQQLQGFEIRAEAHAFESVQDLKKLNGKRAGSFADAFLQYERPYDYLLSLRQIDEVPESEYEKYFASVEFRILNKYGFDVSGGERSEFKLLQSIDEAKDYDLLLIDEPESSFDNIFLRQEVNTIIKDIARLMPVVVVTHNNTVGASIRPDFVLFTQRNVQVSPPTFEIFSGYPSDKELLSRNGKRIPNFEVLMNCLEAGVDAYKERSHSYEILKD